MPHSSDQIKNKDFKQALIGVKPLVKSNRADLASQQTKRKPFIQHGLQKELEMTEYFYEQWDENPVGFEDVISYQHDSISWKKMQALKSAQIAIEEHIDLHGMNIEQARSEIQYFLHFAIVHHIRCIRIVHGKGYRKSVEFPVLKNKVNTWLQQHPQVLAFHSALPKDGGVGAVYVLLKKEKENKPLGE